MNMDKQTNKHIHVKHHTYTQTLAHPHTHTHTHTAYMLYLKKLRELTGNQLSVLAEVATGPVRGQQAQFSNSSRVDPLNYIEFQGLCDLIQPNSPALRHNITNYIY